MFQVAFTGTKISPANPKENEDFNESHGWIDPDWSMFGLNEDREDVTVFEFETRAEAVEKIGDTIGHVEVDGDTYTGTDTWEDYRTGDVVIVTGHITEV